MLHIGLNWRIQLQSQTAASLLWLWIEPKDKWVNEWTSDWRVIEWANERVNWCSLSLQTENTALQQTLSWFVLFSLPPSPSQLQTPSTIAVWLLARMTLRIFRTRCLSILFRTSACEISWFPRLRFCGRCRNLKFTISIHKLSKKFFAFVNRINRLTNKTVLRNCRSVVDKRVNECKLLLQPLRKLSHLHTLVTWLHALKVSGCASPVFVAGHRQGISCISKGKQNIVVHVRAAFYVFWRFKYFLLHQSSKHILLYPCVRMEQKSQSKFLSLPGLSLESFTWQSSTQPLDHRAPLNNIASSESFDCLMVNRK